MADNYLLFTANIRGAYPTLTRKERMIADYMLSNTELLLEATAESIGAATGTSAATVIRFCRTCGFNGLTELKLSLKKEHRLVDPSPTHKPVTTSVSADAAAVIKQQVLGYHNLVINTMLSNWNIDAYNMAVDEILRARRIVLLGEGGSRSSCMCLYYMLMTAGFHCEICSDSVFEVMIIDSLTKDDVVIAITYTGRIRTTIESLRLARSKGVCTIGLVGYLDSPATEHLDIVLNTTNVNKDYYDSEMSVRISENIAIEILSSLILHRDGRKLEKERIENPVVNVRRLT